MNGDMDLGRGEATVSTAGTLGAFASDEMLRKDSLSIDEVPGRLQALMLT